MKALAVEVGGAELDVPLNAKPLGGVTESLGPRPRSLVEVELERPPP